MAELTEVVGRLGETFRSMAKAVEQAGERFEALVRAMSKGIPLDDLLAYEAFVADGGDPDLIYVIEEAYGVEP